MKKGIVSVVIYPHEVGIAMLISVVCTVYIKIYIS